MADARFSPASFCGGMDLFFKGFSWLRSEQKQHRMRQL
jgi:hypothetical protein